MISLVQGRGFAATREDPSQISWHISADAIEYQQEIQVYIATGNVMITGGRSSLEADFVQYSDMTKDALARGNVTLVSGEDVLSCDSMEINLATGQGVVEKGSLFLQKNHLYVEAEKLRKTGQFTYSAEKGSITSCQGKSPDWKITGKNIRVTVEGYGLVSHAAFRIRGVPALYTPFLLFPVKNQRQTGLLSPIISRSDRLGVACDQPLFVALSRSTDLTFFAHLMSERGVKTGARFRYAIDPYSKGTMFFDFLKDDKTDDGSVFTRDYGFSATPQRLNNDRYWFRFKADQKLPMGAKALMDLDIVSDADYLREFRRGHTGYDRGQACFRDEFGRDMDVYSDTLRKNTLTLYRSQDQVAFSAQAVWYDDLVARRHSDRDTALQTLPALCFDMGRTPWQDTGLYYSLGTQFSSFYRKDTGNGHIRGQRLDLFPRVYYPMRLNHIFFFEPYTGIRTTVWHPEDSVSPSKEKDYRRARVLPQAGVRLSTNISRVFATNNVSAEKIQHEMTPGIFYEYIPDRDQEDLPWFDPLDRIKKRNVIGWTLTQALTAKKHSDKNSRNKAVYHDFAWIKLSQEYDFSAETEDSHARHRHWSDLFLEVEISPSSFFALDADMSLCPYTGHFQTVNLGASWKNRRGDSFVSEYRYAAQEPVPLETWYNEVHVHVTRNLKLYGVLEQDLYAEKTIETRAGISLDRACWRLDLEFSESSGDKRLGFLVNLSGLGQFAGIEAVR